jgi:hypothetical protein
MKTVFVAEKSSFGGEFMDECNTLDELKRSIVAHEHRWCKVEGKNYTPKMYTNELFESVKEDYVLFEVTLHDSEVIVWHEYDGTTWFKIEKKVPEFLSIRKKVE